MTVTVKELVSTEAQLEQVYLTKTVSDPMILVSTKTSPTASMVNQLAIGTPVDTSINERVKAHIAWSDDVEAQVVPVTIEVTAVDDDAMVIVAGEVIEPGVMDGQTLVTRTYDESVEEVPPAAVA